MAGKRMSKTELVEAVANQSGLEKKQVNAVLDALNGVIYQELKAQNEVMVPGLLKLSTVTKPAVPASAQAITSCSSSGSARATTFTAGHILWSARTSGMPSRKATFTSTTAGASPRTAPSALSAVAAIPTQVTRSSEATICASPSRYSRTSETIRTEIMDERRSEAGGLPRSSVSALARRGQGGAGLHRGGRKIGAGFTRVFFNQASLRAGGAPG